MTNLPDITAKRYTLWTIQNEAVYEHICNNGRYSVPDDRIMFSPDEDKVAHHAYLWLCNQMKCYVGQPPGGTTFPVWTWFKNQGKTHGKPDMRSSGHAESGEKVVRLQLDVDKSRVLLSDFDDWHCALNYWYLPNSEEDEEKFSKRIKSLGYDVWDVSNFDIQDTKMLELRNDIEQSWQRIFDITEEHEGEYYWPWRKKSIQGTIWEIQSDDIVSVEYFTAR